MHCLSLIHIYERNSRAAAGVVEGGTVEEGELVVFEVNTDGKAAHKLPADDHHRVAGVRGDVQHVKGLIADDEITNGHTPHVRGVNRDGAADRSEVHGCFFNLEAEPLGEGGADDVDPSGVEDGGEGTLPVDLHLEDQAALGRDGDLT